MIELTSSKFKPRASASCGGLKNQIYTKLVLVKSTKENTFN